MRGPPASSRPAGQLTPGVRRCHAGPTRQAARHPFLPSPFPLSTVFSLSPDAPPWKAGRATMAASTGWRPRVAEPI
jgi:hypothetical protein